MSSRSIVVFAPLGGSSSSLDGRQNSPTSSRRWAERRGRFEASGTSATIFGSAVGGAALPAASAVAGGAGSTTSSLGAKNDSKSTSAGRSEEHTSELQSQSNLVCRLLLEKKKDDF